MGPPRRSCRRPDAKATRSQAHRQRGVADTEWGRSRGRYCPELEMRHEGRIDSAHRSARNRRRRCDVSFTGVLSAEGQVSPWLTTSRGAWSGASKITWWSSRRALIRANCVAARCAVRRVFLRDGAGCGGRSDVAALPAGHSAVLRTVPDLEMGNPAGWGLPGTSGAGAPLRADGAMMKS
jgi:hypothetical protein